MRKQYHLWPSGTGFDAWDVRRLSTTAPTVRAVVEHARLMLGADLSFPVILGPDGRVMDGMHRIARALLEGRTQVSAVRFAALPEPDYRDCQPTELPY